MTLEAALQKDRNVFEAMAAFAQQFVVEGDESRDGVLPRRIVKHANEAIALMDAALASAAITGTWSDLERHARYVYENADEQSSEWMLSEAVLVLLNLDRESRRPDSYPCTRLTESVARKGGAHTPTGERSLKAGEPVPGSVMRRPDSNPCTRCKALEAERDTLREELMRVGVLAISDRQDGCIAKTTALRIRTIVHETCWPEDG